MTMPDLFDWQPYPDGPGFTDDATSRAAAKRIAPRVQTIQEQVMVAYRVAWPAGLTADEAAAKIGRSILSVRPRVTELHTKGLLLHVKTADGAPLIRANESGSGAIVLVCTKPTEESNG